jgi:hypothetical protein
MRIRLRTDGVARLLVLLLLLGDRAGHGSSSCLQSRIADLNSQVRSRSAFREWKPDIFYYLFVLLGSFWIAWLTGARWSSLRGLATTVLSFGLLCFLPGATDQLRFRLLFRWPNSFLEEKMARLVTEVELPKELNAAVESESLPARADARSLELVSLSKPSGSLLHPKLGSGQHREGGMF